MPKEADFIMSIRKRGNKYYYTVFYTDDGGVRRRVERAGTGDLRETKKLERMAQADADRERFQALSAISVESFYEQWMEEALVPTSFTVNTIRSYRSAVKNHILPRFRGMKLQSLTPRMLQNFLNDLAESRARASVRIICSALRVSLAWAADMCGYLPDSPASRIHTPRSHAAPEDTEIFSPEDMDRIFSYYSEGAKLFLPVRLAYYTGMRAGECCALQWSDVDLRGREIFVRRTVVRGDTWFVQELPKTKSSVRHIPFPSALLPLLKAAKLHQAVSRFKCGPFYVPGDFVCALDSGEMLTPNDIRAFNGWCKTSIGHGSFHTIRHTYATMLLEAGADLELVSKQLGHSSLSITARVYSHVLDRRKAKLVSIMDKAL